MKSSGLSVLYAPLALILLSQCGSPTQSQPVSQDSAKAVIPVEVSSVKSGSISAYYTSTATLDAEDQAVVMSRVSGLIKEVLVEEGDFVKEGQVIAVLEDDKLAIEVDRANANLQKLEADLKRAKELFDKKLGSAEAYQNALFNWESQKSVYSMAKLDLEFTKIKAPISGVISERTVRKGNMIPVNQAMFKITDFDPLLAVVFVPEKEMSKIKNGQTAKVNFDAIPGKSFDGKVVRISPVVDEKTGTFKTTLEIRDPSATLKPGMFGRVQIIYETRQNTRLIPKEAVIREDSFENVYVVRDNVAYKTTIETGFSEKGYVEVLNGLSLNDLVVTLGQTSLRDSALVEPLK